MTCIRKKAITLAVAATMLLTACSTGDNTSDMSESIDNTTTESITEEVTADDTAETVISSDALNVRKVEGLSEDFIMGCDISTVVSLEESGVKFYDYNGAESDLFEVLAASGVNYIRVRVWNDPFDAEGNGYGGGNCDINAACKIGRRAADAGMKLLVDFHYSDFWADPSKQQAPKAWAGMSMDEKSAALYDYTKESLLKLNEAGADIGMVQIGNETNGGMCGEWNWDNMAKLMAAGSKAVRETMPDALVAVHFTNPESKGNMLNNAAKLDGYGLDYDVFASSYYPYWHGTLENLTSILSEISVTYGKKVIVAETAYGYTLEEGDMHSNIFTESNAIKYTCDVQGQSEALVDVISAVAAVGENGLGVFYWEPAWIPVSGDSYEDLSAKWEEFGCGWASSYAGEYDSKDAGQYYGGCAWENQALFDYTGKPLESLKTFALVRTGNVVDSDAVM